MPHIAPGPGPVRFAKKRINSPRSHALRVLEAATNALTASVGHTIRLKDSLKGLLAVLHALRV